MGLGGISLWQLLIVLLIVVLIFGTKRLKSIGGDLGGAIKGFKKAMDTDDAQQTQTSAEQPKPLSSDESQDADFPEQKKNKSHSG